ncbi:MULTISPECIES: TIGR02391 family protein [unclassified Bradyrhizobium]
MGCLHPSEFDVAAFVAMKVVEVYVRDAGGFQNSDIGQDLMRRAFHEDKGPLTDPAAERSERQARSALFAGAIGCCENPHSHRDAAMEIVL